MQQSQVLADEAEGPRLPLLNQLKPSFPLAVDEGTVPMAPLAGASAKDRLVEALRCRQIGHGDNHAA
jgi:hypothetical protein